MSSRPQFSPYAVIEDGNMSGDITSEVTIIQKLSLISYSLSWDATSPVGRFAVEVSNDYSKDGSGNVSNAGTWNELPLDASTAISTDVDNGFIDIELQGGYAMRLRYIRTSGSGTLQAIISAKVS